jgi:hypothetical protein
MVCSSVCFSLPVAAEVRSMSYRLAGVVTGAGSCFLPSSLQKTIHLRLLGSRYRSWE